MENFFGISTFKNFKVNSVGKFFKSSFGYLFDNSLNNCSALLAIFFRNSFVESHMINVGLIPSEHWYCFRNFSSKSDFRGLFDNLFWNFSNNSQVIFVIVFIDLVIPWEIFPKIFVQLLLEIYLSITSVIPFEIFLMNFGNSFRISSKYFRWLLWKFMTKSFFRKICRKFYQQLICIFFQYFRWAIPIQVS